MKKNYKIAINGNEYRYSYESKYLVDSLATVIAVWYNDRQYKYVADLIDVISTLAYEISCKEKEFIWWSVLDNLLNDSFRGLPLRIDKYKEEE